MFEDVKRKVANDVDATVDDLYHGRFTRWIKDQPKRAWWIGFGLGAAVSGPAILVLALIF